MQEKNPLLSVIIPAYNEEDNFNQGALDKVESYLKRQPYESDVIIVDDGSTDNSREDIKRWIGKKKNWTLIENPHKGKARAIATGIAQARGKYMLFTDFDQATPITEVEKLFPFMEKGYEVAIGSREIKGSKRESEPWYRHVMGRVFNFFVRTIAVPGIQDTQCGFKLFRAKAAHDLFASLEVYKNGEEKTAYTGAFDVELLYLCKKRKLKVAEVPVFWKHVPTARINPVRDSIRMFWDLVRIRFADLIGKYEQ